jgi:hypothetical protein
LFLLGNRCVGCLTDRASPAGRREPNAERPAAAPTARAAYHFGAAGWKAMHAPNAAGQVQALVRQTLQARTRRTFTWRDDPLGKPHRREREPGGGRGKPQLARNEKELRAAKDDAGGPPAPQADRELETRSR